jgi:hypothetical protein
MIDAPKCHGATMPTYSLGRSILLPCALAAITVWGSGIAHSQTKQPAKPSPADLEFFEKEVRPILATHCFKCHGPKKQEAELRLDSRAGVLKGGETGPSVVPGKPEASELITAINYDADGFQMPPNGKLKANQIAVLTKWVKLGSPWPNEKPVGPVTAKPNEIDIAARAKHWSFQPIVRPAPLAVRRGAWPRNLVDTFILKKLEDAKLTPAGPASQRTLLRRATYDLTGFPPTRDEIVNFLADNSPNAYEKVVERLLASPRYGERWGRHWLDLVRFAETAGHEFDFPIHHAWTYRDYVVRALNDDVSYDQFVREHVAGDLLKSPRRNSAEGFDESVIGTAFWWFAQGKHSPVDIRAEECDTIDNQLDVFGKTFLGLTVGCTRCHDHKFDPLTIRDYYALSGYLQSSRQNYAIINSPSETSIPAANIARLVRDNRETVARYSADRLRPVITAITENGAVTKNEIDQADVLQFMFDTAVRKTATKTLDDPLHPWAMLVNSPDAAKFMQQKNVIIARWRKQLAAQQPVGDATVFEDFSSGNYANWFVTGQAFGSRPTTAGDLRLRRPIWELSPDGLAHSGLLSPKLEGELRSKTFTIKQPVIWYRIARFGGKPSPGRSNKNGQLNLIVDGFQFIKNPLYGMLSINLKNDGVFRWVRQDVRKFVGKNAYIELIDEDGGYIVLDQIRFGSTNPPPTRPNALVLGLLERKDVDTPTKLRAGYGRLLLRALEHWSNGTLSKANNADDLVALLDWMQQRQLFDKTVKSTPPIEQAVANLVGKLSVASNAIRPAQRALSIADGSGENDHVLIRGNHRKPGEKVPRRFFEVFTSTDPDAEQPGSGRLQLADKMTAAENPLLARVIVNRLWHHHFGRGIVASPDNFGVLGQLPSHPKLIDWLASELKRRDWSIKQMHRLIMLSSTYRMTSDITSEQTETADPTNLLWHRMAVKRLEGEIIRDALLSISGRADGKMFGPGVVPHLTLHMEGRGRPRKSGSLDGNGRRSIYINVRRNFLTPMFLAFDFPTPTATTGRRSVSNVPAQALTMMNNPFVLQQARVWAERLLADAAATPNDRIARAYEMSLGRLPTVQESRAAIAFLEAQGQEYNGANDVRTWTDFCHVLLNVKEFVFVQ